MKSGQHTLKGTATIPTVMVIPTPLPISQFVIFNSLKTGCTSQAWSCF